MGGRDELDWIAHMSHELKWLSGELTGAPLIARQLEWTPRVDVLEAESALIIRLELAGVRPENVSIIFNEIRQTLVVRGQRGELPCTEEGAIPMLLEIDSGHFAREIELPPGPWSVKQAKTQFRAGILTVVLPKVGDEEVVFVIEETISRLRI